MSFRGEAELTGGCALAQPSRRAWLAGAGALALAGCQREVMCPPVRTGLQLYSVREAMAVSVGRTLDQIAALGYGAVEFAGYFDHTPAMIARGLAASGLVAPSAHVDARMARDHPERVVAQGAEAGHDFLVVAWIPPEDRQTRSDWQAWAEALNRLGEACRQAGLRCAYHNHDFEFVPISAAAGEPETPWDIIEERCEPGLVSLEVDTYWARRAGLDPAALIAADPDRVALCHIKDTGADGAMAVLGAGVTDFAPILAARGVDGFAQVYAELDNPADPLGFAAASQPVLERLLRSNQACPI